MRKRTLNINEVEATNLPVVYTCYGLGSCIGLFISDRRKGLTGGAHIPLPSAVHASELLDAPRLINELLESLALLGSDLTCLRAKITGGGSVYESSFNIGEQNTKAVLEKLIGTKVFIAAKDVGGNVSRTARFNSVTGELKISTSQQKTYSI
jgi:chemotaxis protein CheD